MEKLFPELPIKRTLEEVAVEEKKYRLCISEEEMEDFSFDINTVFLESASHSH